jgi:hypothetical protein
MPRQSAARAWWAAARSGRSLLQGRSRQAQVSRSPGSLLSRQQAVPSSLSQMAIPAATHVASLPARRRRLRSCLHTRGSCPTPA